MSCARPLNARIASPKQDLQGPEIQRNPCASVLVGLVKALRGGARSPSIAKNLPGASSDSADSTVLQVRGIGMVSGVRPWVFRKDCNWSWKYCVIFGGQFLARSGMNHTHLPAPHGS